MFVKNAKHTKTSDRPEVASAMLLNAIPRSWPTANGFSMKLAETQSKANGCYYRLYPGSGDGVSGQEY